ncbi:low molecular weight phosphotyrosine protein phosphatase [Lactobacillus sp. PV037]|uniref:low molecular weight protein-tyrosine-phosphatase n=1 Tax=unclassified Lactobacillus TaxID=2620435 RepID=UPI00223F5906|nr:MULTISPECIES: low molecular weight protein-tyrosine-phosphatase [unclassified Lactobacillus]QNQ82420.1 low molecular weight phosphotyrosine protein phosphatase [Lactobacillus sp. PV012]QNQ83467.1 low molecular weight phosphotyrosine protein phosphatase [Lactobacillus sp. PV037]
MKRIVFVCHGNICRSPMAEFIMKDIVWNGDKEAEYEITSKAATKDALGLEMDTRAKRVLEKHHVPFGTHHASLLQKEDYQKYDYLVGMDEENFFDMNRITGGDPEKKETKLLNFVSSWSDIEDPWYTGDFEKAYQEIQKGCKGLFEKLENKSI